MSTHTGGSHLQRCEKFVHSKQMKTAIVAGIHLKFERNNKDPHKNDICFMVKLETSIPVALSPGTFLDAPFFNESDWDPIDQWLNTGTNLEVDFVRFDYIKRGVLGPKAFLKDIVGSSEGDLDAPLEKLENISIPGSLYWQSSYASDQRLQVYGGHSGQWNKFAVDSKFFRFIQGTLISWSRMR